MSRLTNKQIAEHFGFTPARAAALIRQGMPIDSLENAEVWRQARLLRGQRGGVEVRATGQPVDASSVDVPTDFDETVNRHRSMIETARLTYEQARVSADPNAPKLFAVYEKMLTSLMKLEREALARKKIGRAHV